LYCLRESYHRTGGYTCNIDSVDTDLYWWYVMLISRNVHKVKCWQINGEYTFVKYGLLSL